MIKVKKMYFEEFAFDTTGTLLNIGNTYDNNKTFINMQLDTHCINNIIVFQVRIIIQKSLPNDKHEVKTETAFLNMKGEQVFQTESSDPKFCKNSISKKYIPMVLSAIDLYKEANQSFLNGVV